MRASSFATIVAALLLGACGAANHASAPPPAPAASPAPPLAASSVDNLPIAQYLGGDDATGARVAELLRAAGIKSSAGGSLGYSVWVDGEDRARARQILLAAAKDECLPVTIYDDQATMIPGTRPAGCPDLNAPAPTAGSSK